MSNHKSILATNTVSNAEMSNFSQGQGDQGIPQRRTSGKPHKQFRRLTPEKYAPHFTGQAQRLRKRAISGWRLTSWLEKQLLEAVDFFYANLPQLIPDRQLLKQCKIVSHRGEHDNKTVFENTIAAFDRVKEAGVWGIEFDIRWTKDLQPVVFHDRNLQRVFKSDIEVNKVTLAELKKHCKLIPSLSEVIQKYSKTLHLVVEIKEEKYPDPVYQNKVLKDLFSHLTSQVDFHFISLRPEMFILINFVPSSTFLPIARFNVKGLSNLALWKNYGGITGHYLLITDTLLKKHHKQKQRVGTGFVGSKNCLFRELTRGVEWIFSNNAVELQNICNSLLKPNPPAVTSNQ